MIMALQLNAIFLLLPSISHALISPLAPLSPLTVTPPSLLHAGFIACPTNRNDGMRRSSKGASLSSQNPSNGNDFSRTSSILSMSSPYPGSNNNNNNKDRYAYYERSPSANQSNGDYYYKQEPKATSFMSAVSKQMVTDRRKLHRPKPQLSSVHPQPPPTYGNVSYRDNSYNDYLQKAQKRNDYEQGQPRSNSFISSVAQNMVSERRQWQRPKPQSLQPPMQIKPPRQQQPRRAPLQQPLRPPMQQPPPSAYAPLYYYDDGDFRYDKRRSPIVGGMDINNDDNYYDQDTPSFYPEYSYDYDVTPPYEEERERYRIPPPPPQRQQSQNNINEIDENYFYKPKPPPFPPQTPDDDWTRQDDEKDYGNYFKRSSPTSQTKQQQELEKLSNSININIYSNGGYNYEKEQQQQERPFISSDTKERVMERRLQQYPPPIPPPLPPPLQDPQPLPHPPPQTYSSPDQFEDTYFDEVYDDFDDRPEMMYDEYDDRPQIFDEYDDRPQMYDDYDDRPRQQSPPLQQPQQRRQPHPPPPPQQQQEQRQQQQQQQQQQPLSPSMQSIPSPLSSPTKMRNDNANNGSNNDQNNSMFYHYSQQPRGNSFISSISKRELEDRRQLRKLRREPFLSPSSNVRGLDNDQYPFMDDDYYEEGPPLFDGGGGGDGFYNDDPYFDFDNEDVYYDDGFF